MSPARPLDVSGDLLLTVCRILFSHPSHQAIKPKQDLLLLELLPTKKVLVGDHDHFGTAAAGQDIRHSLVSDLVKDVTKTPLQLRHADNPLHSPSLPVIV
jgi:hypothetical protein